MFATNNYHFCCIVTRGTICTAYRPWYVKCSFIIITRKINIALILVSLLIILVNSSSIVLYIVTRKANKAFSALVISINGGNFLCVIYLFLIYLSNLTIKDTSPVMNEKWKSGPICFTAFAVVFWFTTLNQSLQILISLSRLMIVINPMTTPFKNIDFILKAIFYIFLVSLFITIATALLVIFTETKIENNLCLPFVDPMKSFLLTRVITWFVVITSSVSSIVITIIHISLYTNKRKSSTSIRKYQVDNSSDIPLIVQLSIISLSNFLCWFPMNGIFMFPMNGIFMAAVFLSSYSLDLIMWTTVIVMPLNCVIIPLVFVIASLKKYVKSKFSSSNRKCTTMID